MALPRMDDGVSHVCRRAVKLSASDAHRQTGCAARIDSRGEWALWPIHTPTDAAKMERGEERERERKRMMKYEESEECKVE